MAWKLGSRQAFHIAIIGTLFWHKKAIFFVGKSLVYRESFVASYKTASNFEAANDICKINIGYRIGNGSSIQRTHFYLGDAFFTDRFSTTR
jgi:hypothetical protein